MKKMASKKTNHDKLIKYIKKCTQELKKL